MSEENVKQVEAELVDNVIEGEAEEVAYVPTFDNPDTFISDLLVLAKTQGGANGMALTSAALTLARAGMITTLVQNLKNDPETMALNLASLAEDSSEVLTHFWLSYGQIEEKIWNHKREEEVVGSLVAIIMEEAFELVESCVKPMHYKTIFEPLIDSLKFQIKTLKTGLNVEVDYTKLRDAIVDTKVTLGNMTYYYQDMPSGDDLCEIMSSNMTKIPDDNGFNVNENYKITKPENFQEARLQYWVPKWKRSNAATTKKLENNEVNSEEGK